MNYTVKESRYIRDVKCEVTLYEHNATGARVVAMPANDNNRAISIAFSTPSENSKGIAHIIEHSVLCGSEKYPLKDPFVQLMKGSMYSFLNAITFSDFTMYPVASTNEKDFKNLVGVYLDAAFCPLLPSKKEVFLQEGHHFELDENGEITGFNGVVFNEMKGAESNVDMHIDLAVNRALFADTPYAFESGGLPLDIADLSYEELCDFYRRHYTASNAVIFLYGRMDVAELLDTIDREYLSRYARTERYVIPPIAPRECAPEVTAPYPADETDLEKGHYFSYNFALHLAHTPLNSLTLSVLDRVLCSSQGAVLKKALQKAGIGEDFYASTDDMSRCMNMGFVAAKCRESEKEPFRRIIETELARLVREGIGRERLLSAIRKLEFAQKEENDYFAPKGIEFAIQALAPMLYEEDDALAMLAFFDAFDELKRLAETDYFERFITEHFLNNSHKTLAVLYPDTAFTAREDAALQEKLQAQAAVADLAAVQEDYAALNAYRLSEDTEEDAAVIPLLERSDLSDTPEHTPVETAKGGVTVLLSEQPTNDIAYTEWLFDLRCLPTALLPYVSVFTEAVGAMDTDKHGYDELNELIDDCAGGIQLIPNLQDGTRYGRDLVPYLAWHSRFLYENAARVSALNAELLTGTDFTDTRRLYDILLQLKATLTRRCLESSHLTAREIGLAAYSPRVAAEYTLKGYGFFRFLCELLDDYEARKDDIAAKLEQIREALLYKDGWTYTAICERPFFDGAVTAAEGFAALLSRDSAAGCGALPALLPKQAAAYCAPSQVQYNALCGLLPAAATERIGVARVAAHLLGTAYMWQNVRVLGGAYGCFTLLQESGEATMISYRDPHLDNTLATFRKAADYLAEIELSERALRQYIIGAMNKLDRPRRPYERGLDELNNYLKGKTVEDDIASRRQIIAATQDDLHAFAALLQEWLNGATVTVIGGEAKIKAAAEPFDEIKTLL